MQSHQEKPTPLKVKPDSVGRISDFAAGKQVIKQKPDGSAISLIPGPARRNGQRRGSKHGDQQAEFFSSIFSLYVCIGQGNIY
jgi:hypothetical protein